MERSSVLGLLAATFLTGATTLAACGTSRDGFGTETDAGAGSSQDGGGGGGGFLPPTDGGGDAGLPSGETRDPVDCDEAKTSKSYVGCDYWPTVTPNAVWSIFDYAVVVANTGAKDANVTVTGPNAVDRQVTVPAGQLKKIYLPWVSGLKGADFDSCTASKSLDASIVVPNGAYHLVSSTPVIVYQFSPLEYKAEGGENPNGGAKDWSSCPAKDCQKGTIPCFSFSNDASLLLPSTAMTNNYRVTGYKGTAPVVIGPIVVTPGLAPALTVTATAANTQVTLTLSSSASVVKSSSGPTVTAASSGKVTVTLASAGDVVEFVGEQGKDFSGSLVQSDKPVQVISALPCIDIPDGAQACDHIEETVLPAETLGKHYVVVPPTGPKGTTVGQLVRLYGNEDGTTLTYAPTKPAGCPSTLSAGQTVECGIVSSAFEVVGDKEFGVSTFLLGATVYNDTKGDPSQSTVAAVEQFRTKYVFLAPNDYPVQFADITATESADIQLDGKPLSVPFNKIGGGPFGVYRVDLTKSGQDGAHSLTAKEPVGVQVIGFGDNTSFQYPAGLNLNLIAPPPPPPK